MANVDRVGRVERAQGRGDALWRPALPATRKVLGWDGPLLWLLPVVLLLLLLGIYPLVFNVWNSFREFDPMTGTVEPVGWANWARLFSDDRVWNALRITGIYVGAALLIEAVLGLAIALLLNAGPWGAGLWQSLLILPMVVPPTVAGVMFEVFQNADFGVVSWLLYEAGLLDKSEPLIGGTGRHALKAVLLPDVWQWTPFFVLILLAGLKALPTEPLEAAQVDGAGAWQRFLHITLPMLRPMIAVAVLFRLVDLLKVFDYVYVMTNGGPGVRTEVLSFYAYQRSFQTIEWGYGSVLGIVILVLAIVVANVYVRLFKVEW
jgi:multiple sugar transport system permease protein